MDRFSPCKKRLSLRRIDYQKFPSNDRSRVALIFLNQKPWKYVFVTPILFATFLKLLIKIQI